MNPSTEKNQENHHLYMIGLDPDHPWDKAKKSIVELSLSDTSSTLVEEEARIRRFALRMLERKGVSSSVRKAIQRDPNAILRMERKTPDEYEITVEYKDDKGDRKEEEEEEEEEVWKADEYLKDIIFNDNDEAIKTRLMENVGTSLARMEKEMLDALKPLRKERVGKKCTADRKKEWLVCRGDCETAATMAIQQEVNSTAYILRCMVQSIICLEGKDKRKLTLKLTDGSPADLTGRWEKDGQRIQLIDYGGNTGGKNGKNRKNGRLVMGFGPSASGKTHLSTLLLNQLRKADTSLPTCFLSIDGDIYRESSSTYIMVTKVADKICAEGFDNLISSGMSAVLGSLFNSNSVKNHVQTFLETHKTQLPISLYVPETLGYCGIGPSACEKKYQAYKNLTGDTRWIGLMIWQHRTGKECTLPQGYRCKGCTESGEARQKVNGKKYSNSAWDSSMKNGQEEYIKAPGGSYLIHNSGQAGSISVLVDHSKTKMMEKQADEEEKAPWLYLYHKEVMNVLDAHKRKVEGLLERITAFITLPPDDPHKQAPDTRRALLANYNTLVSISRVPNEQIYRALYSNEKVIQSAIQTMKKLEDLVKKSILTNNEQNTVEHPYETLNVKIWFIRHGYSCANAKRNEASALSKAIKGHIWMSDPSLHPKGLAQAHALGKDIRAFITNKQGTIDLMCTSQLYRAIQTGLIIRHMIASPKDTPIPLHIVPHICESNITRDNTPDKVDTLTEVNKTQMEVSGPVQITKEWEYRTKSDILLFINGPIRTWLLEKQQKAPQQTEYHVFVVAHSTLINDAFGIKLDNCQLYPVTYVFTKAGFLLQYIRPNSQELEEVKKMFPSPYSNTIYRLKPEKECQEQCNVLEDISIGLTTSNLIQIAEQCVIPSGS